MAGESTVGKGGRGAIDPSGKVSSTSRRGEGGRTFGLGTRFCNDMRGAVFVEFIISFLPMFIFFLGIMQLAFSYAAKLVVHHAAAKAARAAIVTEPLPKRDCKGGDPAASNTPRDFGPGANAMPDPFNQKAEATAGDAAQGSPLQMRARAAAYLPLATLAPPTFAYPLGANVMQAVAGFAGQYVSRFAAGYFVYNRSHAAVTFRDASGAVYLPEYFRQNEMVTVHVAYLQYCMIPLVNRIMCNPLADLGGLAREVDAARNAIPDANNLEQIILTRGAGLEQAAGQASNLGARVQERIDYAKRTYSELMNAEYPEALLAWSEPKFRFQMIQSEATLPAQFADYVDLCQTAEQ